jgi:hypothetical protein
VCYDFSLPHTSVALNFVRGKARENLDPWVELLAEERLGWVCHGPTPETWVNQKTSRPTVRIRIIQLQEIPEKLKFENQPQW